jgi:pimeloyl-ACP methyl ester carboxylesterase
METVTSSDGTRIAYETVGSGPPMILLHGGSGRRHAWDSVRPCLSDTYTLVVPDRRGRGESGGPVELSTGDDDRATTDYGLDKEVADLQALVDAVDGTPVVFGHSFGGLVALAAAETLTLDGLVLYEPAVLVGDHRSDDLAARMERELRAGRREAAMALFFEEAGTVDDVRELPWWPEEARLHLAETVIRENYAVEAYELPRTFEFETPTLLLTGEHGPEHLREAVFELDDRIPESRVVELDGVGHVATESAPEQVAGAVESFVSSV